MKNRQYFISGLPRSGSTLLAALLRQNPRFSAGMSSPVFSLFRAMLNETSARNEGAVFKFDQRLGTPGLHDVGRAVRADERKTILPPDLSSRHERDAFWEDLKLLLPTVKLL